MRRASVRPEMQDVGREGPTQSRVRFSATSRCQEGNGIRTS
jgi:hypothetical protein